MRAQQRRFVGHPSLEEQDGVLEEGHLLSDFVDEENSAEAARLANTNVDHSVSNCEFDYFDIGLVDEHELANLQIVAVRTSLPALLLVVFQLL